MMLKFQSQNLTLKGIQEDLLEIQNQNRAKMNELIHVNDQIDENAKSKFHRLELQIQDRSDVNALRVTKVEEELR